MKKKINSIKIWIIIQIIFVFVMIFVIIDYSRLSKENHQLSDEIDYLKHHHGCCLDFKVSENKRMSLQKHVNKLVSEYSKNNYYLSPEYNSIEYFTPSADFFIFEKYKIANRYSFMEEKDSLNEAVINVLIKAFNSFLIKDVDFSSIEMVWDSIYSENGLQKTEYYHDGFCVNVDSLPKISSGIDVSQHIRSRMKQLCEQQKFSSNSRVMAYIEVTEKGKLTGKIVRYTGTIRDDLFNKIINELSYVKPAIKNKQKVNFRMMVVV